MNTAINGQSKPAVASRMTLGNVTKGKIVKPIRALCYGVAGVGKSTLASNAPSPIFLCGEDGAAQLDVARFPSPRSWADVLEAVRVLTTEQHPYKTLVIDSLDWLEPIAWAQVCAAAGKASIGAFQYGAGYTAAVDLWRNLLRRLGELERVKRMNIVLIAHAAVEKHSDPFAGEFDRYRLKLHKKSADLIGEWVDLMLFARHDVSVTKDRNGKTNAKSSGSRFLYSKWCDAFDAKSRYEIPERLPLSWEELETEIRSAVPVPPEKLRAELETLIAQLPPAEQERAREVEKTWVGSDTSRLAQLVDRVRGKVMLAEPPAVADASEVEP